MSGSLPGFVFRFVFPNSGRHSVAGPLRVTAQITPFFRSMDGRDFEQLDGHIGRYSRIRAEPVTG
jgi:hypothetical protein